MEPAQNELKVCLHKSQSSKYSELYLAGVGGGSTWVDMRGGGGMCWPGLQNVDPILDSSQFWMFVNFIIHYRNVIALILLREQHSWSTTNCFLFLFNNVHLLKWSIKLLSFDKSISSFSLTAVLCICCAVTRSYPSLAAAAQAYFTDLLQATPETEGAIQLILSVYNQLLFPLSIPCPVPFVVNWQDSVISTIEFFTA